MNFFMHEMLITVFAYTLLVFLNFYSRAINNFHMLIKDEYFLSFD